MDEKILAQRQKRFALASSPNEHEAALAASMAADLMAKHHLEEATVRAAAGKTEADVVVNEAIDDDAKKEGWLGALANGAAKGFGCRLYWHRGQRWELRMIGRSEAIRLIKEGAVEIDGEKVFTLVALAKNGSVVRVGKRRYFKVILD